jgi:hypothetical protein
MDVLGESVAKPCRTSNIMYRPNTETLRRIDSLVAAGHAKSRADLIDMATQRYLAWEEYMRVVTHQLQTVTSDDLFIDSLAQAILPAVKDKIKEKL